MNRDLHNGMQCSQFEALLADALDYEGEGDAEALIGSNLAGDVRQAFLAHRQECNLCGPLFDEARRGMMLLRSLEIVEPPRNLMHNILAATSGKEASAPAAAVRRTSWMERLRFRLPAFSGLVHSRFATSFAMAFFSVSLTLSLAGVNFRDIGSAIVHPMTFRRTVVLQYTQVEARVVSYYENLRVVYEWEAKAQQLRKVVAPASNDNKQTKPDQPEQQNQNHPVPNTRPEQEDSVNQGREASTIARHTLKIEGAQL